MLFKNKTKKSKKEKEREENLLYKKKIIEYLYDNVLKTGPVIVPENYRFTVH